MGITTKTGDMGQTVDFRGKQVSKAHVNIELSGAFDAAQTALGFALAEARRAEPDGDEGRNLAVEAGRTQGDGVTQVVSVLVEQQRALFACMDELAGGDHFDPSGVRLAVIECHIAELNERITFTGFILPGGSELAARLDLARVSVRDCERAVIAAADDGLDISQAVLAYLNRLSDYLYLAARSANASLGVEETSI